jgi:hypothetical protein
MTPAQKLNAIVSQIRRAYRRSLFARKKKSSLDRSLEAFVRVEFCGFSTLDEEKTREEASKKALAMIRACRDDIKGKVRVAKKKSRVHPALIIPDLEESQETLDHEHQILREIVRANDMSREPWDVIIKDAEAEMTRLVADLPGFKFQEATRGFGAIGFAQIVGEAGNLSAYKTPSRLWKRLGYAPYGGLAMSTWLRPKWRPRPLEKEEWIENPFKPERYAIMAQIGLYVWMSQWIGKNKTEDGVGKPNGPYGEVYQHRREHTATVHPDWTDGHAHLDALRYVMKRLLLHVYRAWHQECPYDATVDKSLMASARDAIEEQTENGEDRMVPRYGMDLGESGDRVVSP